VQHSSEHNAGHFQANKELRLLLHSLATLLAVFTLYRSCTRAAYINFAAICLSKTKAGSAEELPLVEGLLQRVIHLGAPDARANHLLGVAYIARSAWPEASEQLEKGLEVEPDDVLMHYRLAKVYEQQGRSEEMREELEMVQAWDALRAWRSFFISRRRLNSATSLRSR
jgi:tetratricopeptide (TPR) repeat protein